MADPGLFKRREDVKKEILKLHEKNNWYLDRHKSYSIYEELLPYP